MVESDNRTSYQGENFTGRPTEEPLPPAQESQQTPGKDEVNEPQEQHPAFRCRFCNLKARMVTGGRLWCPQCRQVVGSWSQGAPIFGLFVIILSIAALLFAAAFYITGTFDHNLHSFGLNWEPCAAQSSGKQTLCGDQLPAGTSASNGVREKLENLF